MTTPAEQRCGFVAVIGAPNAGKSTLVNLLVGAKVSIVTHKVQTTRTRIRGVSANGAIQIVYVDTPGIFKPRRRLDRAMVDAAWGGVDDADVVLLLVDAPAYHAALNDKSPRGFALKTKEDTDRIAARLDETGKPYVLVLNKVDAIARSALLELTAALSERGTVEQVFMISAQTGDGVDDLKPYIESRMPVGPWLYPEDQLSDITERLLAAETTREKLYLRLHEELPYASTVETESWKRNKRGELRIEQIIYVARDSQKGIVLGKGGATIKEIGSSARQDLEQMLGEKVHLFLRVKVREKWEDEPARYREMGLDIVD